MKRLLLLCALALSAATASTLLQPPQFVFDAGVFHAFLAALAIIAALTANSVIARQRGVGQTGPLGSGMMTVAQTFWTTMAINIVLGSLLLQLDATGHGTDSYAMGIGALLPHAIAVLAVLACLTFLLSRWWPLRLTLAAASGCIVAFVCMALTWWR